MNVGAKSTITPQGNIERQARPEFFKLFSDAQAAARGSPGNLVPTNPKEGKGEGEGYRVRVRD